MLSVPKRVVERLVAGIKQYQPVLRTQRDRDVSEADTVTIVKDLLADAFGYDKYSEVSGEHAIRGTRCDLAVKIDGKLRVLLEVKAIGLDLKEVHVKQAIDYAANQGVDWVILTNAVRWILFHVSFAKPIDKEEVADIDLLAVETRKDADLERLYLLTKEGLLKEALAEFRDRKDATSRFMIAAILTQSDAVIAAIRKEVRRVSDILVDSPVIEKVLRSEVIKRELLEGEAATDAAKRYNRAERTSKPRKPMPHQDSTPEDPATSEIDPPNPS
ncbi:MAG TPA: restriction endonuclease subunit R [Phycisphaerales bacterium]|nr:restriction endonuclease subunit R [Phycisphaerales bacterium]